MKRISLGVFGVLILAVLLFPEPAAAQPKSVDEVVGVLERLLVNISRIFWVAAVGFILYAGFLFLTSADNSERLEKAKKQLLYTVIAIAIALMATVIPTLVENILGGK